MKLEDLNAMKYGEILKLAKEKLNITRRVSKELLIEKLLQQHQALLSDSHFISTNDTTHTSTIESEIFQEPVKKRGRKRGNQNQQCKEKDKPLPVSKKAKKEYVEPTLNSTFSVDEESDDANNKDLPSIQTHQEIIPRKLRGRKKAYLTEESSANESENEKVSTRKMKKSSGFEQKKESVAQGTESGISTMGKVQILEKTNFVVQSLVNKSGVEKQTKRKLNKSTSTGEHQVSNESVTNKKPTRKIRSSEKGEIFKEKHDVQPPLKQVTESNGTLTAIISSLSQSQNSGQPDEPEKKTLPMKTSNHWVRSRKLIVKSSTPAKLSVTPATSAKKMVHFTGSSDISNIPKMVKPKAAPNFSEIHQKNFMKMQSVDEYVDQKRTRTATMNASAKTVRTKSVLNSSTPQAKLPITNAKIISAVTNERIVPNTKQEVKFNFVSGLQKPVFTAKGQVVNEKQRVMATIKENLHNNASQIPAATASIGKRKVSMLNVSRDINTSKLSMAGKQILKGVRTNRRFELQMQHRNMKN